MRRKLSVLVLAILVAPGCASEKPVLERGWIGGEYETYPRPRRFEHPRRGRWEALPEKLAESRRAAVIVTRAFESTPAHAAGLREGDLVFEADSVPVESAPDLLDRVDVAPPGSKLKLKVYRLGEVLERDVIVGRERYTTWRRLSLGITPLLECDLFPNPDFSIFGLVSFWTGEARLELRNPRHVVAGADGSPAITGDCWGFWLGIFGLASYREVLSQEPAEEAKK